MTALRNNEGKPELAELLHFDLAWLADHMAAGRKKYPDTEEGTPNWRLGGKPDAEYLNAAVRHLTALVRGEEFDTELGTHHAAAVAWNMMALLTCNRDYEQNKRTQTVQPTLPFGDKEWGTVNYWYEVWWGDEVRHKGWEPGRTDRFRYTEIRDGHTWVICAGSPTGYKSGDPQGWEVRA